MPATTSTGRPDTPLRGLMRCGSPVRRVAEGVIRLWQRNHRVATSIHQCVTGHKTAWRASVVSDYSSRFPRIVNPTEHHDTNRHRNESRHAAQAAYSSARQSRAPHARRTTTRRTPARTRSTLNRTHQSNTRAHRPAAHRPAQHLPPGGMGHDTPIARANTAATTAILVL